MLSETREDRGRILLLTFGIRGDVIETFRQVEIESRIGGCGAEQNYSFKVPLENYSLIIFMYGLYTHTHTHTHTRLGTFAGGFCGCSCPL